MSSATPILDAFRAQRRQNRNLPSAPTLGLAFTQAPPDSIRICLFMFIMMFPFVGWMLLDLKFVGIPFGITPNYVLGPLLALFWFGRNKHSYPAPPNPLRRTAFAYIALCFLSVLQSASIRPGAADFADKQPWVFSFTQSIYVLWILCIFLVVCDVFATFPSLRIPALRCHLLVACFVAGWGIYQWIAYYLGWNYITVFNNNPYRSESFEQTFVGLKRVSSVLHEPSDLGLYLMTAIPLVAIQFHGKDTILRGRWRILVFIMLTITLFLSTSFSGYLTFVLFLVLFLATGGRWRNKRTLLMVGAVILVCFAGAAIFFASAGGRFSLREAMLERAASARDDPNPSTLQRSASVIAGFQMFLDHPLIGVGEGNSGFHYDEYSSVETDSDLPRINALLPKILAEHGLVGCVLFLLLLYRAFRPAGRKETRTSDLQSLLQLSVLACFFDLFISCFDMERYYVWFIVAILFSVANNANSEIKAALASAGKSRL